MGDQLLDAGARGTYHCHVNGFPPGKTELESTACLVTGKQVTARSLDPVKKDRAIYGSLLLCQWCPECIPLLPKDSDRKESLLS